MKRIEILPGISIVIANSQEEIDELKKNAEAKGGGVIPLSGGPSTPTPDPVKSTIVQEAKNVTGDNTTVFAVSSEDGAKILLYAAPSFPMPETLVGRTIDELIRFGTDFLKSREGSYSGAMKEALDDERVKCGFVFAPFSDDTISLGCMFSNGAHETYSTIPRSLLTVEPVKLIGMTLKEVRNSIPKDYISCNCPACLAKAKLSAAMGDLNGIFDSIDAAAKDTDDDQE